MSRSRLFTALAAAFTLAVAAQAAAGAPTDLLEEGRAVYNFRCYFCHGYSGNAKTQASVYLAPPPVDFTRTAAKQLTREAIIATLRYGRPGTAMKPFSGILSEREMMAVASFVLDEFVVRRAPNTHYHTAENGWPDHQRYRSAFPFATGEIPLSRSWESLDKSQAAGKRLYLASCVSCHDRGAAAGQEDLVWDARPLSYPRIDAMMSATPYGLPDIRLKAAGLNSTERRGERLFQNNCAFCHGADGTGKNWIGQFLEPHPRNLRDPVIMTAMTRQRLEKVMREGLPNTSMPAWKNVLGSGEIRAISAYIHRVFHPLKEETPLRTEKQR